MICSYCEKEIESKTYFQVILDNSEEKMSFSWYYCTRSHMIRQAYKQVREEGKEER